MAHLIKLFNCSGNHYHHHRCSIIHHFWRALLTSGAHSPALLKPGQISPTPLGVSVGCNLSPVESCPKAYSEGGGGDGQTNKQTNLSAYSLSYPPPPPDTTLFSLRPRSTISREVGSKPGAEETLLFTLQNGFKVGKGGGCWGTVCFQFSGPVALSQGERKLLGEGTLPALGRLLGCPEPGGLGVCSAARAGRP